jgi:hypothetical protein
LVFYGLEFNNYLGRIRWDCCYDSYNSPTLLDGEEVDSHDSPTPLDHEEVDSRNSPIDLLDVEDDV